jgi:hypothetical protein
MTTRRRNLMLLGAIVALAIGALIFMSPHRSTLRDPVLAIPESTFLAITIDFDKVRASDLLGPSLIEETSRAAGTSSITTTCGFDPLARVHAIAIAVPEGGDHGDFGVAAFGDATRDELVTCAKKLMPAQGAENLTTRSEGSFTIAADGKSGANANADASRFAFRDGGPYIVARGAWLETMLKTAEGSMPSIASNEAHASLRKKLGAHAIVATAILPKSLRDRLKREMGAEIADASDPAATNSSERAMAGVLGVSTAGIAFDLGDAHSKGAMTTIAAEFTCENDASCTEVAKVLERKRAAWSRDVWARLLGLGPAIDAIHVEAHGASLYASTTIANIDLSQLLDRLLRGRKNTPPSPLPTSGAVHADERIAPHAALSSSPPASSR